MAASLKDIIDAIPIGYSEVFYQGKRYGLSKSVFNAGKSSKIFAEELGGNDFISLNFYETSQGEQLKPCEMPEQKVIHFLRHYEVSEL